MSLVNLAAVIMVKNEELRILTTLESIKHVVDGIIIFDTGSKDKTIEIIKKFTRDNNINCELLQGEFKDFAQSRNQLLEFANTFSYDYLLLLDCNDELLYYNNNQYDPILDLKNFLSHRKEDGFMLHQCWYVGQNDKIDYYNLRIIKTKLEFKYKGSVHEYLETPSGSSIGKLDERIVLYQDRVKDNDGKSRNRWEKDLVLLQRDLKNNPNNGRTQFYLAQTHECLNNKEEALKYYKWRANNDKGFYEERFNAMLKCGDFELDDYDRITWYLKAFQIIERADPLVEIVKIYRKLKLFKLAFIFAKLACDLSYPFDCVLWINKKVYDHDRWQELGIVAYYVNEYEIGRNACKKAIKSGHDIELNQKNLLFYEKNVV